MTTDEVLAVLAARGLRVEVDAGGGTRLRGPAGEASAKLLRVLRLPGHREEVVRRFRPAPCRRLVLLAGGKDSEAERVLWESADKAGALQRGEGRRLAKEHAGRTVAAEWRGAGGRWERYWWVTWPQGVSGDGVPATPGPG